MKKHKIFVSAYACEPYKGSEIGVGWNWILQMAKEFELFVLTRSNNRQLIEQYFSLFPEQENNIHFVYYDLPETIKRLKKKMKGIYWYYPLWCYGARRLSKRVIEANNIKIYHHLTYGNILWSINPMARKMVFIWGPVGGIDTISDSYLKNYSIKSRVIEGIRRIYVNLSKHSIRFKSNCSNTNLIICKTKSLYEYLPLECRKNAVICTDVAAESKHSDKKIYNNVHESKTIKFISVGRLDAWRGFDILIESFTKAHKCTNNIQLQIIGDGNEKRSLEKLIKRYKADKFIQLIGNVEMDEYKRLLSNCDVMLNSCLKEGGVTTAFDCIATGKPMICLDTGGYTNNFDTSCSIVIPHTTRKEIVHSFTTAIIDLCDLNRRKSLGEGMREKEKYLNWECKGVEINRLIRETIINNRIHL